MFNRFTEEELHHQDCVEEQETSQRSIKIIFPDQFFEVERCDLDHLISSGRDVLCRSPCYRIHEKLVSLITAFPYNVI